MANLKDYVKRCPLCYSLYECEGLEFDLERKEKPSREHRIACIPISGKTISKHGMKKIASWKKKAARLLCDRGKLSC